MSVSKVNPYLGSPELARPLPCGLRTPKLDERHQCEQGARSVVNVLDMPKWNYGMNSLDISRWNDKTSMHGMSTPKTT